MVGTQSVNVMFMRHDNAQSDDSDERWDDQTRNNGVKLLSDDKA
jgi:hypothetical protein